MILTTIIFFAIIFSSLLLSGNITKTYGLKLRVFKILLILVISLFLVFMVLFFVFFGFQEKGHRINDCRLKILKQVVYYGTNNQRFSFVGLQSLGAFIQSLSNDITEFPSLPGMQRKILNRNFPSQAETIESAVRYFQLKFSDLRTKNAKSQDAVPNSVVSWKNMISYKVDQQIYFH